MASWPRDPWLRPEPGSQEAVFTGPGSRPEALLVEAGRIRCQVKPHVTRARRQALCEAGRIRCQAQLRTRGARCQVHHRLENTACRLSTDRHVQGRQTNRPGHRTCAASAWLSVGKVRSLDTCTRPGLIPRCQVACTETKARGRGTCATSAWLSKGKDYVYQDEGTCERYVYFAEAQQVSPGGSRRHVEETRVLHRGSASEPKRKPGQVGPAC